MPYISLTLILFAVAGLVFIVGTKISEIKSGKSGTLARFSMVVDPILRRRLDAGVRLCGNVNVANTRRILGSAAMGLFHIFGTVGLFVSKHYVRATRWVKGRKYIKGRGVVSFFLKSVAESKGEKKDEITHN